MKKYEIRNIKFETNQNYEIPIPAETTLKAE